MLDNMMMVDIDQLGFPEEWTLDDRMLVESMMVSIKRAIDDC